MKLLIFFFHAFYFYIPTYLSAPSFPIYIFVLFPYFFHFSLPILCLSRSIIASKSSTLLLCDNSAPTFIDRKRLCSLSIICTISVSIIMLHQNNLPFFPPFLFHRCNPLEFLFVANFLLLRLYMYL
jgi:hypothetical protein